MYTISRHILQAFTPISLTAMDERARLRNRTELKYMIPQEHVAALLSSIVKDYLILEIENKRVFGYTSWYFDTGDMKLYKDHVAGNERRIKIRQRLYEDSGLCFFEVKRKKGDTFTEKSRLSISGLQYYVTDKERTMLAGTGLEKEPLSHTLTSKFDRITLCGKDGGERVTIDTNMTATYASFTSLMGKVAIVEVKQERGNMHSAAVMALRKGGLHSGPFSKYAAGMAMLSKDVKYNNQKPILLKLNKHEST